MRISTSIIVISFLLMWSPVYAEQVVIKHQFMDGTLVLVLDDRKIDPEIVKQYLVVHPVAYDPNYHIAPSIRLCIEKDPRYFPCGNRDHTAQYFLQNAEVNIQIGLERVEYLNNLDELTELQPLVEYFKNSLEFSVWREQQLFRYYQTWNIDVLRETYKSLPFTDKVYEALRKLERAQSTAEKWDRSLYKWANAVNHLYRTQEGPPPKAVWDIFILKYAISERIEWEQVD